MMIDARDVIALIGLGLLSFGCWLAWPPLGAIAPGLVLTWYALRAR